VTAPNSTSSLPGQAVPPPPGSRGWQRSHDHRPIAAVLGILGVLVVGQLRGQATAPGLGGLSAQELTVLIANLNSRNGQLRDEVATIERQLASLTAAKGRGDTALDQLRADLARIRAWSGATGLVGPGISVAIRGPIAGDGVEDLLNELHNAGAEAVAIGQTRIVPGVVVSGLAGSVQVTGGGQAPETLGAGFEIRAIGSAQILTGTLTRAGGIIAQFAITYPDTRVTVTPLEEVRIPATSRDLAPANGRPAL
jgi:uncharacterized protein YlxW (UPF0749 family)